MSEQEPFHTPYEDAPNIRGVLRVIEPGPDGTLALVILFPVPLAALSLVAPKQTLGFTMEELADAAPEVQTHVMGAWFRVNYQPRVVDDPIRLRGHSVHHVSEDLRRTFFDLRTGLAFAGSMPLIAELAKESPFWVEKPPEPLQVRRQNALDALDELEAAIRRVRPDTPGRDDNHPPELLDDTPATLDDERREALAAIEESRRELHAERPNFEVLRRSAQTIIKLARIAVGIVGRTARTSWPTARSLAGKAAVAVAADAYLNGADAAANHVAALWHSGVNAAMALQAYASSFL